MRPRGRGEGMSDPREGRGIGRGMTGGKWEERGCLSARPTAINQMKRQHLSFFPYHLHLVLSRTDNDLQYTQPLPLPDVEEVTTHSMQSIGGKELSGPAGSQVTQVSVLERTTALIQGSVV